MNYTPEMLEFVRDQYRYMVDWRTITALFNQRFGCSTYPHLLRQAFTRRFRSEMNPKARAVEVRIRNRKRRGLVLVCSPQNDAAPREP